MIGKGKTQIRGRGEVKQGWDFGSDFISGLRIHIPPPTWVWDGYGK